MREKDAIGWIFATEEDGMDDATKEDLDLDTDAGGIPIIGNDDPTVRTSALPDTGLDSAVHDIRPIVRRQPTA